MKIYIAGKITGLLKEEYTAKFAKAENALKLAGWTPVNPCRLGIPDHATTQEALKVCIPILEGCKAIYMLSDWRDSPGAIIERSTARHNKIDVYHEDIHPVELMQRLLEEVI
jgi:hypothetical protein